MCNTSGIISNVLVGLVTGAASSYLVTVFIQRKIDKKNHDSAKNKLSSYLRHIFDELAVVQQKQELLEDINLDSPALFDFGSLIHLLALAPEYTSIDYVSDDGKQLLNEVTEFIDSILESCFEYNFCSHLEFSAIKELNNYQNKVIEYSKRVQQIEFKKKWWKAI